MQLEDIILHKTGYWSPQALRPYCAANYVMEAARFALQHPGTAFIATGLYINRRNGPEVDGPAGAIAIGNALLKLGWTVCYVTDHYAIPLLAPEERKGAACTLEFPIVTQQESASVAERMLAEHRPTLLVAVERLGRTLSGRYRNARGHDITANTARIDELFLRDRATIGIGDGGNEIGMGIFYEILLQTPSLSPFPTTVAADHTIVASVSNWGAYGLVAGLSILTGTDLLPDEQEHAELIRWLSVDMKAENSLPPGVPGCDGFSLEENLEVIRMLRDVAERQRTHSSAKER